MANQSKLDVEYLLERAKSEHLLAYNRVNGEILTLQIGRVLYTIDRSRATAYPEHSLQSPEQDSWRQAR